MSGLLEIVKSLIPSGPRQHAIPSLDGVYVPNERLERLRTLRRDLARPDDVAAGDGGDVYVSSEHRLLRLSGENLCHEAELASFNAPITAMARLRNGSLAVGLNANGLRIVSAEGQTVSGLDRAGGAPLRCVTAIAEDPERGGVFFTVGSTRCNAEDWVVDLMERSSTGLIAYWQPGAETAEILLSGLAYPNGIEVESSGESLLFTQSWTHSLSRYRPGARARASVEVVIENMPGYPARIAPANDGGHWLAIFAMRTQLIELVLREPAFRKEMMRHVDPELWIRPALRATGSYLEPLQGGGIKKLGIRKPWAPPRSYGLVLRLDSHGEPMFSMHSRVDGRNHGVTAAREIGNRLVVVSKGNDRLLVEGLTIAGAA
jgi:hypothetical protein